MIKRFSAILLALFFMSMLISCSSIKMVKERKGDVEIVTAKDGSKIVYQLKYTYSGGKIVKGEHWLPLKKDEANKKEKTTNMLSDTAIAKKFNDMLQSKKVKDTSGIELGIHENGMRLNFVLVVQYNSAGQPAKVMRRGYTNIPILGRFLMQTDFNYTYDGSGKLIKVTEQNMNVDTLLLKFAIGNYTNISRDAMGRPTKVIKVMGTIPPSVETTDYSYSSGSNDMSRTVYEKVGLVSGSIKTTEKITVWYRPGVSWEGKTKYIFDTDKTISGLLVWDNIARKNKLDGSGFSKMNYIDKVKFLKSIYDLIKMEMQGPTWRMGDLPDVPEPFLIYGDYAWYN